MKHIETITKNCVPFPYNTSKIWDNIDSVKSKYEIKGTIDDKALFFLKQAIISQAIFYIIKNDKDIESYFSVISKA
jgi:hypothetical protein